MNKYSLLVLFVLMPLISFAVLPGKPLSVLIKGRDPGSDSIYVVLDSLNSKLPSAAVFEKAMKGMYLYENKTGILAIIDFTMPSTEKRLWIIDLKSRRVLYHTLVAHGRNTGELYAGKFSNIPNSNQSSLGFYTTGKTYVGKNGL